MFVHPTQPVEIFGNVSRPFCTLAIRWPPYRILRRSPEWILTPPSGVKRKRGSAKYSDCEPVEGYISETVQDTASGTMMKIITIKSNDFALDPLGWPLIRVLGPQFWYTVYISEFNRDKKVKSDAHVAMNKNSDFTVKCFSGGWWDSAPNSNFFKLLLLSETRLRVELESSYSGRGYDVTQ